MNPTLQISIEPMRAEHGDSVSALLLDGFRGKLQSGSRLDDQRLRLLLIMLLLSDGHRGTNRRIIAIRDGIVIGSLAVQGETRCGTSSPLQLRLWWNALQEAGFRRALGLILRLACLSHRPATGERYISDLVIHSGHRGAGVGRMLLEHAIREVSESPGCRYTSLHAASANTGARRLYERLGFRTREVLRSATMAWLFGESDWHYMIREI